MNRLTPDMIDVISFDHRAGTMPCFFPRHVRRAGVVAALLFLLTAGPTAQEPARTTPQTSGAGAASAPDPDDRPRTLRRHRRTSRAAEIKGPRLLQVEYGYNGDFRARATSSAQAATLTVNYAPQASLLVEFAHDNIAAQTPASASSGVGVGNTYLGLQYSIVPEATGHPSVAVAYQATMPTGSQAAGITSGGVWHRSTLLVSKDIRTVTYDVNAGALLNDLGHGARIVGGAQVAVAASKNVTHRVSLQAEIAGQTRDADEPRGTFASATLVYQANPRWQWDVGVRVGLTPAAPRVGVFGGFTRAVSFGPASRASVARTMPRRRQRRPAAAGSST